MNRYLVETSHNREECTHVLGHFAGYGFITHFEWGCPDGICTGWAIIEADSEKEAMLSVPPIARPKSRVIKLTKFTPEMIQSFHEDALQ